MHEDRATQDQHVGRAADSSIPLANRWACQLTTYLIRRLLLHNGTLEPERQCWKHHRLFSIEFRLCQRHFSVSEARGLRAGQDTASIMRPFSASLPPRGVGIRGLLWMQLITIASHILASKAHRPYGIPQVYRGVPSQSHLIPQLWS